MQTSSMTNTIQIRVLNASTGVCYPISLHGNELTRDNIQRHLAAVVPKNDQILLLGPPYKPLKDHHLRSNDTLSALHLGDCEDETTYNNNQATSTTDNNETQNENDTPSTGISKRKSILQSTEQTGSKRIFLFSKQALSESAPDPQPCILSPQIITLPNEPDPSPIFHDTSSPITPLHQALAVYERQFMLNLCQGRSYADAADLRLTSSRNCIKEQNVIVRALRAAVCNLSDHWNNATRTRLEFTSVYEQKMEEHGKLLRNFENVLKGLCEVELDKELKAIARSNGRVMETLFDTVPQERMRSWYHQCQTGYVNLQNLFGQLDQSFNELHQLYNREEDGIADLKAELLLEELEKEVEVHMVSFRNKQAERFTKLTEDHKEVVGFVLDAVKDEGIAQAAFNTLNTKSKASADIIPAMEADDVLLREIMSKVADVKTASMKRMKTRLRQICIAQNRLLRVQTFAGMQGTLRETLNQHCDNMTHLEHYSEFPASYRDFLSEIRRRRAYGDAVTSMAAVMIERVAAMRNDEVKAREKFVRGPGRHLMPSFYEMFVPTLGAPPPLFTPQFPAMVEMNTLPNVTIDEENKPSKDTTIEKVTGDVPVGGSSSSLTESSIHPLAGEKTSSIHESVFRLSISKEESNDHQSKGQSGNVNEPESLIVSADERSGEDVIMETGSRNDESAKAEADAERKTLIYENAILRQTLERISGKKTKTYLDDAKLKQQEIDYSEIKKTAQLQAQLESLQKELDSTKSELKMKVKEIKKTTKSDKMCDKISHSSFEVGDIALFMPTGAAAGGKRTYVAFHSNCPHRYLSTDNIEGKPNYVLGRIVYQEELVAGAVGTDTNPHKLHAGTKFWILTVEVLNLGGAKGA